MEYSSFVDFLWIPEVGGEFQVPGNALLRADNVELLADGTLRGRKGTLKYNSSAEAGAIKGLWRHYPRTGTPVLLSATDVGASVTLRVGTDIGGTFANVTGGTGLADVYHYFVNWPAKNKTFIANGTDNMKEYDGSTLADVNGSTPPAGPYLTVHKSRLWATEPSELNYSVYASDINDENTWPAANHLQVSDPMGGTIRGLASFMDSLLIFKSTSLWRFIGDIGTTIGAQLARYSDKGCVAPNTICSTPFGVFFLANDGLYLTDGVNPIPQEMSVPIRSLFRTRTANNTFPLAVGMWDPYRMQYVLTLDPSSTTAYIVKRVPLTVEKNLLTGERTRVAWAWSLRTATPANAMCAWSGEGDSGQFLIGSQDGFVRYTDTGTTDDGTAITSTIKTASRLFDGKTMRTARVYNLSAQFRSVSPLTGALYYDNHPTSDVSFTLGDASVGAEPKYHWRGYITNFAKQGRFVAVELSSTESSAWELSWIKVDARFRSFRVRRNTN